MTEITWLFDVSVFEKLPFGLSTLHHLGGVFIFLHPGDRFRKASFSVTETPVFGEELLEIGILLLISRRRKRKARKVPTLRKRNVCVRKDHLVKEL